MIFISGEFLLYAGLNYHDNRDTNYKLCPAFIHESPWSTIASPAETSRKKKYSSLISCETILKFSKRFSLRSKINASLHQSYYNCSGSGGAFCIVSSKNNVGFRRNCTLQEENTLELML